MLSNVRWPHLIAATIVVFFQLAAASKFGPSEYHKLKYKHNSDKRQPVGASSTSTTSPCTCSCDPYKLKNHHNGNINNSSSDNFPIDPILQQILVLVNEERAKNGSLPLKANYKLHMAAQLHAEYIDYTNHLSHTGLNGSSVRDRVNEQEYNWKLVAENVLGRAPNTYSARKILDLWMNSYGHRINILNPDLKEYGSGMSNGVYVQVFATPMKPTRGPQTGRRRETEDKVKEN